MANVDENKYDRYAVGRMIRMRITGNDKLDPDFSSMKKTKKILGIISIEDMKQPDTLQWLLPRINPRCEICNDNQAYQVELQYYSLLPLINFAKTYHLVCNSCGDTIELDYQEYLRVKSVMNPSDQ